MNLIAEDYDIIAIVESWLTPDINTRELFDSRYEVIRQDRDLSKTTKESGGGIVLAVKKEFPILPMTHWNKFSQGEETLWAKCTLYGQEVYIALSYFPSPVKPKTLQVFSETLCNRVELAQKRLILLGDYNIPEYQIDTEGVSNQIHQSNRIFYINRLMSFYELKSFNHIKNKFGRTLDLYLSNFDNFQISRNKISHTRITLEDGLVKPVDHHPPLSINIEVINIGDINNSNNTSLEQEPRLFFKKTDFHKLKTELGKKNWDTLEQKTNVNDCLSYFYQELNHIFDLCVPKFSPKNKKKKFPFWWDKKSIKMFKKKERLRKMKNLSAKQEIELKNLKKSCKTKTKQDYLEHIKQISHEIKKGNSKPFWQFTKEKRKDPPKTILTYNEKEISNPQEIADAFAEHFMKAYNHTKSNYHPDFSIDSDADYFHLGQISESDVSDVVRSMPKNKPPGPDGIPPLIFVQCIEELKFPLTKIINLSLNNCVFPDSLKESVVHPVPKKPMCSNVSLHRPVSNLNAIAKIYEGVLYNKISNFIFNKISENQHGFVNKKSTISNLVHFTDFIARTLPQADIHVVYTDIEKCFDRLSHDSILQKLVKAGFSPPLVNLFSSYLQNRRIYVEHQNFKSTPFTPPSGVAQGSKLSSLIFILAYNEICQHVHHSNILLYADDVKIFRPIRTTEDSELLQEDLDSVNRWLSSIGLNFHPEKCSVMVYSNKRTPNPPQYSYKINTVVLKYVNECKDLGINFQSNLNFDSHRQIVECKGYQRLGMITRYSKPIQDIDVIRILYQALVRSILEYGSVIWLPHTQVGKKAIERIQARFVRGLFFKFNNFYPLYPHHIEYNILTENLDLDTLESRREKEQMKLLISILNGRLNCPYILEKLHLRVPNNRLRPSSSLAFHLPNRRETTKYKSPIISAMSTYNSLEYKPDIFQ